MSLKNQLSLKHVLALQALVQLQSKLINLPFMIYLSISTTMITEINNDLFTTNRDLDFFNQLYWCGSNLHIEIYVRYIFKRYSLIVTAMCEKLNIEKN